MRAPRRWRSFIGVASVALSACNTSGSPLGGPHGGSSKFKLGPTDAGGYLNVDATWSMPLPPFNPGQIPGKVGSWTHIYYAYFVENSAGNCSAPGNCHQQDMPDPMKAYGYLQDQGYVGVSPPPLVQDGSSCLAWYGGDMPLAAPPVPDGLKAELMMWAAAGGLND